MQQLFFLQKKLVQPSLPVFFNLTYLQKWDKIEGEHVWIFLMLLSKRFTTVIY